ncbi:period circadian protein homolog 2-like isoform X2 [Megalops cyprinoides]|uniref:period circadian protein homolog 2-like isoform X2 n=1 Tax=Megalops cyprinoides TaxID=118141 RepID=UPI0018649E9C|nr:period circadian protein homolog 2-like isoform X2 [Megalops cyprinoides]
MSEDSDSKGYQYSALEGRDAFGAEAAARGPMAQLRHMGGFGEGSDSSQEPPASPHGDRKRARALHEDVEMNGSGSSGSGTESHGNESHGNDSNGNESLASSNGNGKDSALLESSGSNKSSNSHSPSPPSSSNAFSLLSASSEQDNPSTSGCSSEQSAKAKTQKELIKTLKDLKLHLPSEKRNKGKSSTLNTLKYALRCVKQVKANEEYYQMLMINDSQPPGLDVSSYTIGEIDGITSEYTLKNTDIFAVAVSLITGKIVYISDQAASILNCKRDVFKNAKFAEFLSPQDVSVFYSFTTPYRLPSWSMCTGAESSPSDCMQEKSFFCRISGGREREGDLQYYPFRMTPYLMKVQDTELAEEQFCCLLLAERVHSGYEAPRIPTDKRIFTTTHTPNCVFQDVDERAVPLLGYLPQDLIGTPVLLHLHPSDRPLMLAVHRKILQYMGQPFDHSSIRFCARNGEYVTIDTSWSSFVNPWSRKVSFVIGRHKVRMGPVNEDVFAAPAFTEGKIMDSDILEITEQIHKLLLQPVHSIGSSGYGSLGSNGSHEQLMSVASSSESNGNSNANEDACKVKPRTFQEICKDVHMLKNQEQQVFMASAAKPEPKKISDTEFQQKSPVVRPKDSAVLFSGRESVGNLEDRGAAQEQQMAYSYQQISCLDSVIRYLESCNIPITVKRKCQSSSNTTSSNSDEDKQKGADSSMQEAPEALANLPSMKAPKKPPGAAVVGASLAPLALPSKAESVVSITSQCSYSSTIVHVGDKKPQPESEIIEDVAESPAPSAPAPSIVSPPSQEKEPYKKLGLTKQVLAAHTQKEEQAFLSRCREQLDGRTFRADCSLYLERHRSLPNPQALGSRGPKPSGSGAEPTAKKGGRNKKTKKSRMKKHESSDSTASHRTQPQRPPLQSLNQTSWSPSDTSQSTFPIPYPAVMPAYPLPVYPGSGEVPPRADPSLSGFGENQGSQDPRCPIQAVPYSAPLVTPMVAFVLPNYMFPQMGAAPRQPFYPEQPAFPPQGAFQGQASFPAQASFPSQPAFPFQTQFVAQPPFPSQAPFPAQPFNYSVPSEPPKASGPEPREGLSRSSTPLSGARDQASPPLFESRCSSPLQLNLLQLEETTRSVERQDSSAPPAGAQGSSPGEKGSASSAAKPDKELQQRSLGLPALVSACGASACGLSARGSFNSKDTHRGVGLSRLKSEDSLAWNKGCSRLDCCIDEVGSPGEGQHSDAHSSSIDLLDILLQEDSRSGTGSATSGSLGSGSHGCSTSASGVGSSQTSNTSKYFGSIDSSENDHKAKARAEAEVEESEHFIKYVLQEPIWLLMANADESVMMTYQIPSRDVQKVLKEDRERLRQMQKSQPRFTEEQMKELAEVHPWMRRGGLPKVIDTKECLCCKGGSSSLIEEELPDMDLRALGDTSEEPTFPKGGEEPLQADARPGPDPVP